MFPSTLPTDAASPASPARTRRGYGAGGSHGSYASSSRHGRHSSHSGSDGALAGLPLASLPEGSATDISSLSPSLLMDLQRFERDGEQRELLEVLAACLRHTQSIAVRLAWGWHELTLSLFPLDALVHCPMPIAEFLGGDLAAVRVLRVQPASLRPPGDPEPARIGQLAFYAPMAPLLWAVATRGSRAELLPELGGLAAYRLAPGFNLGEQQLPAELLDFLQRLRQRTCNLREIAEWHSIGRERASRLLNALYLQSGLIVTRTHPAATNDGWSGYR